MRAPRAEAASILLRAIFEGSCAWLLQLRLLEDGLNLNWYTQDPAVQQTARDSTTVRRAIKYIRQDVSVAAHERANRVARRVQSKLVML